jgi:hypothetical protein
MPEYAITLEEDVAPTEAEVCLARQLACRALELASLWTADEFKRRVLAVAVLGSDAGNPITVVAVSSNRWRAAQKAALDAGEQWIRSSSGEHAEQAIYRYAASKGLTVKAIGASINFCPVCRNLISKAGGCVVTGILDAAD